MAEHRLDPLLKPASIALVGVSERADSPGHRLVKMVLESDYAGDVYLVNPRYPKYSVSPAIHTWNRSRSGSITSSSHSATSISKRR